MQHTYYFREGVWTSEGNYTDENGTVFKAEGETTVLHQDNLWISEGLVRVFNGKGLELRNTYEIIPFGENCSTNWLSVNPVLSPMKGILTVVDNTILSIYRTEDNNYFGSDVHIFENEVTYQNRGSLHSVNGRVSSWALQLRLKQ